MSRWRIAKKRYECVSKLTNQEHGNFQEDSTSVSQNTKHKKDKFTLKLFFKAIVHILKGDVDTQGELTTGSFAILSAVVFKSIALAGMAFAVIFVSVLIRAAITATWIGLEIFANAIVLLMGIVVFISIILYSIFFWGASNEIMKEKDKNFVIGVFSGMVGFAALVVALVTLYQGVS